MSNKAIDLFLTYQFLRRLATPFEEWDAFKLGIIDKDGKVLKKGSTLDKPEERNAWGYFDRLVANLKKLLAKVPGGKTKIGTYAAALLLIKESSNKEYIDEDEQLDKIEEELIELIHVLTEEDAAAPPANNVGNGAIAGVGIGPQGEPGVRKKKKKEVVMTFSQRVKVM